MPTNFAGERANSLPAMVEQIAAANNARVVRDALIDLTVTTADYSYIIVDQYGLLVVDVEMWPGATIRGGSTKATWRARHEGAPRQSFPNPVTENARRVDVLLQALLDFGKRIAREHIIDMVVFIDADTRSLSLTDADKARVVDGPGLIEALRLRYDFAINCCMLDRVEIEDIVSVLRTIDRSDTPEALARHAKRLEPRPWFSLARRKPEMEVGLSNQVLGIAPVASRITGDRYPDLVPVARRQAPVAPVLALLAVAGLAVWLFLFGGYDLVSAGLAGVVRPPAPSTSPASQPGVATVDIGTAKMRFAEVAPDVYAKVVNLDAPSVVVVGDTTVFTWEYLVKTQPNAVGQRAFSLTLGSDGSIRGMSAGK